MCLVNPTFLEHVAFERNRKGREIKVLYIMILRALYGCLESALLSFNLYLTTRVNLEFEINLYCRCVANKVIDGSQYTKVFYIDDNKINHKYLNFVTKVIIAISEYFGEHTISPGDIQDFLGMNIQIKDHKVYIEMKN